MSLSEDKKNLFSQWLVYVFAFSSVFSLSLMTVFISIFLLYYILNIRKNFFSSPQDFLYFVVFYLWRGITDILNGYYSVFFKAFGDIWDKLPYLTVSQFRFEKKTIENFLKILLWANIIVIAYALLQKYAGFPIIVKKLFTDDWLRFKGYHSHPLRFAGYLSTVVVIAFSFGIYYKRFFVYMAGIIFSALLLNGSRTYWFSVVITFCVISFLKSWRVFIYTFLLISFIGLGFYYIFPETSKRVKASYDSEYGVNKLSNIELRKNFWKAGFEISVISPVYGIGAKKVGDYLEDYKEKGLIDNTAHCHNIYITSLAETGIIGVGMLIFIIFYFLRKYFLLYKKANDEFTKTLAVSAFALWLNVALGGIFENNFSTFVLWGLMSVWLGIVEGYIRKFD